jgi:hypothetical protein
MVSFAYLPIDGVVAMTLALWRFPSMVVFQVSGLSFHLDSPP